MGWLKIGELSKLTGVQISTLRTWERRYGWPIPRRSGSGHRTYAGGTVELVRWAKGQLEAGHRAGEVMAWCQEKEAGGGGRVSLMPWVQRGDAGGLIEQLERAWYHEGVLGFLDHVLPPLLREVGQAWAQGELGVNQEHLCSEAIRDFLASQWRSMSRKNQGRPQGVCATLPGEQHTLGLHMVAATLGVCGWEVVFLGQGMPLESICAALEQAPQGRVLCVSVSPCSKPVQTKEALNKLHRFTRSRSVSLVAGGGGVPENFRNDEVSSTFSSLAKFISSH